MQKLVLAKINVNCCSVPGKRPCTSFQEVNVAASIQMYGNYVPCMWAKIAVCVLAPMGAYPGHYCKAKSQKSILANNYHPKVYEARV